jgi:tyrosinase
MPLEIEVNGSTAPSARYIAYAPSPCRIRQTPAAAAAQVKLESKPAQAGGGQAVFYATPGAKSQATLQLTLPANGAWVPFGLGGKFQVPSVNDRDCLLIATAGSQALTVPLMVRVRKNANKLQPGERDRFLNALAKLNARGIYQTFRDIHVLGNNNVVYSQEHAGPHFLPWHRTYLLDLERELQAVDVSVSLHYWRFDQVAANVFKNTFMGATKQVNPGGPASNVTFVAGHPLSGWVTDGMPGILRSAIFDTQTKAAPGPPGFPLLNQSATLALGTTYAPFAGMESSPHGAAHVSFAGWITSIGTAAKDPLFYMLHSNVDRLWGLWQWFNKRTNPADTKVYQGQNVDGRRVGDTTWPWNGVVTPPRPNFAPGGPMPPSPVTSAPGPKPTIGGVVDFQGQTSAAARVGYGYDDVPFEFS